MVLAYAARGSTGFGAAAAMPLMSLIVPMKVLVPAWTILGVLAGLTLFGREARNVDWKEAFKILPTCLVGIVIGVYLFSVIDGVWLTRGLGVLVLLYGIYALWISYRPLKLGKGPAWVLAPAVGFVGGLVGATFGTLASLFFAIYLDAARLTKEAFRATMTAVLLVLATLRVVGYWAVDEYNSDVWFTVALALPTMLLGIFLGYRIHTSLSELTFRRLVCMILIISGAALVVK